MAGLNDWEWLVGKRYQTPASMVPVKPDAFTGASEYVSNTPTKDFLFGKGADTSIYKFSPPPVPQGLKDIGGYIKEGWNRLENTGSNRLTPYQAKQAILDQIKNYPVSKNVSPEEAMRLLSSTNGSRSTAPTPALPPMSDAARMEAQKGVPTTTDSAAIREAARIESERKGLIAQGYTPLNNQPGAIGPRSGASYLGPNDLLVKERLATPKEYTQAVNANQMAAQRGRIAGLPQDPNTQPYTPNDATLAGMKYGGPITEYAIPGKGTATFLGERQGGGTLSVVSGRTPEEQKVIDAQVRSINSQTNAMRALRNANRQAQGLPTVEQEDQMNDMAATMARMMPSAPDSSQLNEQEARYLQDLQNATALTGIGQGRLRDDRIKAAQLGLAQIDAQRKALEDRATRGQATGISLIQNMTAQDAARAKAAQDQAQWAARYGLDVSKMNADQQKAIAEEYDRNYGFYQKDRELAMQAAKDDKKNGIKIDSRIVPLLFKQDDMGNPTDLDPQRLQLLTGIRMLGQGEKPVPNQHYLDPTTNTVYRYDLQGNPETVGLLNLQ